MAIALKRFQSAEGMNKEEVEKVLLHIAYQLEKMDQQLKVRTDNETWRLFQEQQQEVYKVELTIKELLPYK
ncbi:hypothetical protein M3210_01315 [Oceanobacillus luteolus]|uniref:Uncharacterized protein n=1 Tax=Oceanobacillus luteolus TaxID=1274358 RepID=A0ABW4HS08_9BACI|nr:hypothetical protein [Oceanobacillus luteolus]MCM3738896.1 hypothetical protein [Oceanobacillus luteolus]